MNTRARFLTTMLLGAAASVLLAPAHARAQGSYAVSWWTVGAGGGTSSAGSFTVSGSVGRPDAGIASGGSFAVSGGLWPGMAAVCYPDCNGDGALNLADFGCFQTRFALGNLYADCNGDGVLNLADFGCFQTRFALGCP